MITKELEGTLNLALKEAKTRRHEYVSLEHLLFALLRDKDGKAAIVACGGDLEKLGKSLEEYFTGQMETLPQGWEQEPQQTLSFHRVLQRAVIHAQSAERKEINGGNMLIAMYREPDSYAVFLLQEQGITRFDLVNYVSHGVSKFGADEQPESQSEDDQEDAEERPAQRRANPLEAFTVNLVDKAGQGLIDPLIGRDDEIERTIHVLCRRRKNNPI
jgi:ATP-dependent Clp protease ATP-binding subunit ClpA